jgi:hypothetical protein
VSAGVDHEQPLAAVSRIPNHVRAIAPRLRAVGDRQLVSALDTVAATFFILAALYVIGLATLARRDCTVGVCRKACEDPKNHYNKYACFLHGLLSLLEFARRAACNHCAAAEACMSWTSEERLFFRKRRASNPAEIPSGTNHSLSLSLSETGESAIDEEFS